MLNIAIGCFLTFALAASEPSEDLIAERAVDHHRLENEKPTLFDRNQEALEEEMIENAEGDCCEHKCIR